jgi:hypothetical protein
MMNKWSLETVARSFAAGSSVPANKPYAMAARLEAMELSFTKTLSSIV